MKLMTKKVLTMFLGAGLLLSSCGTYTATGAYTGAQFGQVLGSAVGGINGGWRGHEMGTIVGTVGGAAAGAAIGSAIERGQQRKYERRQQRANQQGRDGVYSQRGAADQSGFDPQGRGDDRIDFMNEPATAQGLQIRNVQIVEQRRDGALTRGEELTVVFEVMNNSDRPIFNVRPLVEEATRNRHIHISQPLQVDRIDAHRGVRYTARVLADQGLKTGQIVLRIGVAEGQRVVPGEVYSYDIPTAKSYR